jgi:hypothetical protein
MQIIPSYSYDYPKYIEKKNIRHHADLPKLNKIGYTREYIGEDTIAYLKEIYKLYSKSFESEKEYLKNKMGFDSTFLNIEKTPVIGTTIMQSFTEMLESFFKEKVKMSIIHGFRTYKNGSKIKMHKDTLDFGCLGIIIPIDQKGEPWDFHIEDHDGNLTAVPLSIGQAFIFESAKLTHGRIKEFTGEHHTNLLLSYHLEDYILDSSYNNSLEDNLDPKYDIVS